MNKKQLDADLHQFILYRSKGASVDGVIWYRITIKGSNGGRIRKSNCYRDLSDAIFYGRERHAEFKARQRKNITIFKKGLQSLCSTYLKKLKHNNRVRVKGAIDFVGADK